MISISSSRDARRAANSRLLLWRLHGLAALLALPFVLIATITGLIYLPTPQIEAWQMARAEHSIARPLAAAGQLGRQGRGRRARGLPAPPCFPAASARAIAAPAVRTAQGDGGQGP